MSEECPRGPVERIVGRRYRMLTVADRIEPDDEFLGDDCESWLRAAVHARLFVGLPYCRIFHPMRRATADWGKVT